MADRRVSFVFEVDDTGFLRMVDRADRRLERVGQTGRRAGQGLLSFKGAMTTSVAAGTVLGNVLSRLGNILSRAVIGAGRLVVSTFKDAITASTQFSAAFIGLTTIAAKFGIEASAAKTAAAELSADGLMTIGEAAAGLKNLLASGFGLPEAIQLMKGFKDSAAFNRQASLEFGHAIVSATEGIKNQNSILVDNVGLTKNLSVIMKEAGLAVSDLAKVSSNAGVRAKFLAGLMGELALFTGDAARAAQTYTGAMTRLGAQWDATLAALGNGISTNLTLVMTINKVSDGLDAVIASLENGGTATDLMSAAVIGLVKAFGVALGGIRLLLKAYTDLATLMLRVRAVNLSFFATLLETAEGMTTLASSVPGVGDAFERLGGFISGALDRTNAAIAGTDDRIMRIHDTSVTWQEGITGLRGEVDRFVGDLEAQAGATVEVQQATDQLTRSTDTQTVSAKELAKQQKEANKRLTDAIARGKEMNEVYADAAKLIKTEYVAALLKSGIEAQKVKTVTIGITDEMLRLQSLVGAPAPPTFFATLASSMRKAFEGVDFGQLIVGAFQGGGDVGKTLGAALGKSLGDGLQGALKGSLGGGKITSLLTSFVGPLAALGGSLLGGLFGKLGGGPSEAELAGRDAFRSYADGLASEANSDQIQQALGSGWANVDDAQAWIVIRDAILQTGGTVMEAEALWTRLVEAIKQGPEAVAAVTAEIDTLRTSAGAIEGLQGLVAQAQATGELLPTTLAPYLEQLQALGLVTGTELTGIMSMFGQQTQVDWQAMQQAAERYGIALSELGPQFDQARLSDTAQQLVADFDLLAGSGANVGAVLSGMSEPVQKLIADAAAAGVGVPAEMQPIVEQMIEQGLLTDEAGQKLTDIGQVRFAAPVVSETEQIISKIDELIQRIVEAIGGFSDLASTAASVPTVPSAPSAPASVAAGGFVAHTGGLVTTQGIQRLAAGGRVDGVPLLAQPGEFMMRKAAVDRIGTATLGRMNASGSAGGVTVIINAQGAVVTNESALEELAETVGDKVVQRVRDERRIA